jgi:hypothetical protein
MLDSLGISINGGLKFFGNDLSDFRVSRSQKLSPQQPNAFVGYHTKKCKGM